MLGIAVVLRASAILPGYLLFSVCLALNATEIEEILEIHNQYRRLIANATQGYNVANMNKLRWSRNLQAEAERRITCNAWRPRHRRLLGMNAIADKHQRGVMSVATMLRNWFEERRFYDREMNECAPWYSCQEFRTMTNALQHSIGCAKKLNCRRQGRLTVLLCFYQGGPTLGFDFNFRHGDSCSKCERPHTFCEDNLCVSCEDENPSQCDCRKTCWKESVGQGSLNRERCTCDCRYGLGPNCDEPCKNPVHYFDNYDPCREVAPASINCTIVGHLCPEQCLCRPFPRAHGIHEK